MGIILATEKDVEWINNQYKLAGFVPSDLKNEIVAIVTYNGKKAGVGRLVQIDKDNLEMGGIYILPAYRGHKLAQKLVSFLVQQARKADAPNVYCIPFENLGNFYKKYGFKKVDLQEDEIHETIIAKYNWCLQEYDKNVLLFRL
ncbi:GNAT family N-acetyltransferase [Cytobacillus sp. IB215316]|uniref:GNAT family N-acetyltransferase n=1 Tax=Cytobacillus sp. IB215316 TaxID=3097354 RepID=UPI002A0E29DF|nr:GNAT family N-acetyltransferase [Cytobacillus sp. IB215316]MDX8360038.1 GNAT family N-acetyltransferase [Cytobacillus sp. IB215316]